METFLFTDIADSTRLWQQFPQAMSRSMAAIPGRCYADKYEAWTPR